MRRAKLVLNAIDLVLRRLSAVPVSPEAIELRTRAEQCLEEAVLWQDAPPTVEEAERLMNRVLRLHAEVVRVERAMVKV